MKPELEHWAAKPRHVAVIMGGAVAGSEAAALCVSKNVLAIVIEQNPRPYGKIEDGLPRWHEKLRQREYERIDANLSEDGVLFLPCTRVGDHIDFDELLRRWRPNALVLANGAWRDRPLPVPGVERYLDKGLVYQNPLVYWFNHYPEPGYDGPHFEIPDGTLVIGGGLASIDVCKIINLELYARALRKRGIDADVVQLEHRGIPAFLKKHDLEPEDLGLRGVTLYYRRRKGDMPLASMPEGATPEQQQKVRRIRERIMDNCTKKYLVRLEECHVPVEPLAQGDRLVGLRFRRTEVRDGKLSHIEGSEQDVRAPMVVSSIGSVPEMISGIPSRGELYDFADWNSGELSGLMGVYGLGNVLTGQGNIKESRINARQIGAHLVSEYLGLREEDEGTDQLVDGAHRAARQQAEPAVEHALHKEPVAPEHLREILHRVEQRWEAVGYTGDYRAWLEKVGFGVGHG